MLNFFHTYGLPFHFLSGVTEADFNFDEFHLMTFFPMSHAFVSYLKKITCLFQNLRGYILCFHLEV